MTPAVDWLTLLRAKVAASSNQAVADELDVSRTTISLVLADKYPAKTGRQGDRHVCPRHLSAYRH